jgi:hypothetical protein
MRKLFFKPQQLKLLTILLGALLSLPASSSLASQEPASANVQLKFTISQNGHTVAHPEIQVELNHTATVIQQEARNPNRYKIEVTPRLDASSAIRLEFRISEVSGSETTLLSTPSVIVFNGDSANVSQKKAFSDELKVTVTPTLN